MKSYIRPEFPQPTDLSIRRIALTQNQFAIVDAGDYEWLTRWLWCASYNSAIAGFYAVRNERLANGKKRRVYMHRELLGMGSNPLHVDHANRDTLDNRRENLRVATRCQNQANQKLRSDNTSGFKGVSWCKLTSRFVVQISLAGKRVHRSTHETAEEAAIVYHEKAKALRGEFFR